MKKCTCQGFYQPLDCPVHGRDKKFNNRHDVIKALKTVSESLMDNGLMTKELGEIGFGNLFLSILRRDILTVTAKLEKKYKQRN